MRDILNYKKQNFIHIALLPHIACAISYSITRKIFQTLKSVRNPQKRVNEKLKITENIPTV